MMTTLEARVEFAGKIVLLIEEFDREIKWVSFYGKTPEPGPRKGASPPVNWNWALATFQTDGLEEMIVADIYRSPVELVRSGAIDVDPRVRDRIQRLFEENRLLVAECELGGSRYGSQT